jgi:hypothetical protein
LPWDEEYRVRVKTLATWFNLFVKLGRVPSLGILDLFGMMKMDAREARELMRRDGHMKLYGMVVEGRYGN